MVHISFTLFAATANNEEKREREKSEEVQSYIVKISP